MPKNQPLGWHLLGSNPMAPKKFRMRVLRYYHAGVVGVYFLTASNRCLPHVKALHSLVWCRSSVVTPRKRSGSTYTERNIPAKGRV